MKSKLPHKERRQRGWVMTDLVVAIAILGMALIPLTHVFLSEKRFLRQTYHRAVLMEVVDGEMEILAAGGWKSLEPGEQEIPLTMKSADQLPEGRLVAIRQARTLQLEWRPKTGDKVYRREVALP